jgi:hypothetical protein
MCTTVAPGSCEGQEICGMDLLPVKATRRTGGGEAARDLPSLRRVRLSSEIKDGVDGTRNQTLMRRTKNSTRGGYSASQS